MNIESKTYSVRSIGGGLLELMAKQSGRIHHCPIDRMPSANALAMMHERDFNRIIAKEMS